MKIAAIKFCVYILEYFLYILMDVIDNDMRVDHSDITVSAQK